MTIMEGGAEFAPASTAVKHLGSCCQDSDNVLDKINALHDKLCRLSECPGCIGSQLTLPAWNPHPLSPRDMKWRIVPVGPPRLGPLAGACRVQASTARFLLTISSRKFTYLTAMRAGADSAIHCGNLSAGGS